MTTEPLHSPVSGQPAESFRAFLGHSSRFLFFTGKGGVGKTSLACATAVALADAGKRVLLVSTDPASNLDEVLGQQLNGAPTPSRRADGLQALNIDPEAAAQAYRDRMVGPYRGKLPEAVLRSMEEQLSGACTTEIAAFDEFARLLGEPAATAGFDHVVFDTAPTGHTLRLMTLPAAWTGFLDTNTSGTSCLGPLAGLQKQREVYESVGRRPGRRRAHDPGAGEPPAKGRARRGRAHQRRTGGPRGAQPTPGSSTACSAPAAPRITPRPRWNSAARMPWTASRTFLAASP